MFDVDTPDPATPVVGDEVDVTGMGEGDGNWFSGAAEDGTDDGDVSVLLFSGDIWGRTYELHLEFWILSRDFLRYRKTTSFSISSIGWLDLDLGKTLFPYATYRNCHYFMIGKNLF